ncbi:MAG: GNAT family N-acetyltransferase [Candidatus Lokiarchaeota archaeon]|nr:GNAT family N-acetyltransferase [Candidatus Lokiarchaeota archaeon]
MSIKQYSEKVPKSKWLAHNYKYYTRMAETEKDFNRVFRIRYSVFHDELNEAPYNEEGLDYDAFDINKCADYVLLCVKETEEIVGLYRTIPHSKAIPELGYYYSAIEFNLDAVINDPKYSNSVSDLGRLVILKEHRGGTQLLLLWMGLLQFCINNKVRYLLGCGSLAADITKKDVEDLLCILESKGMIKHKPNVFPRPPSEQRILCKKYMDKDPNPELLEKRDDLIDFNIPEKPSKNIELPFLIRRYQQVGAVLIGYPSFDGYDFGTYDLFVMIDRKTLKTWIAIFGIKAKLLADRLHKGKKKKKKIVLYPRKNKKS